MTPDASPGTNPPEPSGIRRSRWIKGTVIGGIALVALLVGGPFIYIHVVEGDPPAALSVDKRTTDTQATHNADASDGATTGSLDGTWKVASGSQAGYRVKEVLFGQNTTAVGRTSGVTGHMTIAGTAVTAAAFTADMTSVTSDQSQRDGQFRGRIMETSRYPTAMFTLTRPIDLGSVPGAGEKKIYSAVGDLTLHGVTRTVTISLTTQRSGTQIMISGQIPIMFADYNINNPSFGGIRTDNDGIMEVGLTFTRNTQP